MHYKLQEQFSAQKTLNLRSKTTLYEDIRGEKIIVVDIINLMFLQIKNNSFKVSVKLRSESNSNLFNRKFYFIIYKKKI